MVTNNSLCSFDWRCLWVFFVSSGFRILGWPLFSFISLEMLIHYLLASIVSVKSTTVILTVAFFKVIYLKFFFYSAFKIFFYTFGLQQYYSDVPRYLFPFLFQLLGPYNASWICGLKSFSVLESSWSLAFHMFHLMLSHLIFWDSSCLCITHRFSWNRPITCILNTFYLPVFRNVTPQLYLNLLKIHLSSSFEL